MTYEFDAPRWSEILNIEWDKVEDRNKKYRLMKEYLLKNGMELTDLNDIEGNFWEIRDEDRVLPLVESIGTMDEFTGELIMIIKYLDDNHIPRDNFSVVFNKDRLPHFIAVKKSEIIIGAIDYKGDIEKETIPIYIQKLG